jgi:hypothetical protein
MYMADSISISAGIVPFLWSLWFRDVWLLGALFLANVAVAGIKELVGSHGWTARPAGAWGCDAFCVAGGSGGRPGFPSGHMTTVSMFVAVLWFRFGDMRILWVGVPWIFAMAWARWVKLCHNLPQIAGGVVMGVVSAYIYTQLISA